MMKLQQVLIPAALLGAAAAASVVLYVSTRTEGNGNGVTRPKRRTATMVRVTENGQKYHREDCPLLHGASSLIPISEALGSYEPCKACHPPGT